MGFTVLNGGKFGFALDKGNCVQLGTHGSLMKAEEKNIKLGGPKFYSPGVCPAQFKYLKYGEHVLSAKP
eukprot:CAMPEP_0173379178 /NCGR_PEP_ID=MMETSP1356-20130122/2232_1 /TAXON_ID=77927 ORGANISM="Hemiselmis virescens, Strain PCC157" /NCGR_SAMPLE_ID=MMETSP1356 /ASSEMBLY_ACC=CAM_ASM_000847 /LENGTH=68 /DNA_ID=CAMNT_0014332477 /DNA_START=32 /DNA_END=238 /DNA_ORIENTATION=-